MFVHLNNGERTRRMLHSARVVVISRRHSVLSISTNPLERENISAYSVFDIGYVCVCVCAEGNESRNMCKVLYVQPTGSFHD